MTGPTLRLTDGSYGWQDDAACLGIDPEMFFTDGGPVPAQVRAICDGCNVRRECLDFAMDVEGQDLGHRHRAGIFGGLSGKERGRLAGHMRRIDNDFPLPREGS
jgi:WhiB family redox-sensing transcriptional regulator